MRNCPIESPQCIVSSDYKAVEIDSPVCEKQAGPISKLVEDPASALHIVSILSAIAFLLQVIDNCQSSAILRVFNHLNTPLWPARETRVF